MGLIRLLLAIDVILSHTSGIGGYVPLPSNLAVQCFYIISGFYMALILNENYTGRGSTKIFYINRALKIYPIYWVVLIIKVTWCIVALKLNYWDILGYYQLLWPISFKTMLFLVITNIIIIGLDLYFFLNIQNGGLYFSPRAMEQPTKVYTLAFNTMAWTVSLELIFYLFAPMLTRLKTRWVILILGISLSVRVFMAMSGYSGSPWNYMFLPSQVAFFMAGILSYKLYIKLNAYEFEKKYLSLIVFALVIVFCFTYNAVFKESAIKQVVLFILFTFSIPIIFKLTKSVKYDRWLGNLSYPVYISQVLFISFFAAKSLQNKMGTTFTVLLASLIFGILLDQLVSRPIEKYRRNKKMSLNHAEIGPQAIATN